MSLNLGASSKTTKTSQSGQRDPWDETIPYLQDFLKKVGSAPTPGATPGQTAAFDQLKTSAAAGNPLAGDQAAYAKGLYDTPDRTGVVGDAYTTLQSQIGDTASGKYLDPMSNPQMKAMLAQVGDDISNRTSAMFAGAGRDLSGAHQGATAKGVSQGTLGLLLDQYNKNQAAQAGAASTLYSAGAQTGQTQSALDAQRAGVMGQGAAAGDKALEMGNYGPTTLLNLEQQQKQLPYEDLAMLGSLLFPVAGLGGQEEQQGKSKTTGMSVGAGLNLLSDERAKTDIEEVGRMADGTPIYRYRYKDDDSGTIHMGPMAQEVEEESPEAVDDNGPGGLKTVNMDAATRKAAEIVRQRRGAR